MNSFSRVSGGLNPVKKKISEGEDSSTEITQSETKQKEKTK